MNRYRTGVAAALASSFTMTAVFACGASDDATSNDIGADSPTIPVPGAPSGSPPTDDAGVSRDASTDGSAKADSGTDAGSGDSGPTEAGAGHMWIGVDNEDPAKDALKQFDLPLSPTAPPSLSLGAGTGLVFGAAVRLSPDAKRLWVMDPLSKKVFGFDLPLAADAIPAVSISVPLQVADGAFDSTGNLWLVGNTPAVFLKLSAPITSATVPDTPINIPQSVVPYSIALDSADRIYISAQPHGGIVVFDPNPTAASTATFVNTAVDRPLGLFIGSTSLFVVSDQTHTLEIFPLPFSAASVPVAGATLYEPRHVAMSPTGDLAVATFGEVEIMHPPTFATVAFVVNDPGAAGVAFGP